MRERLWGKARDSYEALLAEGANDRVVLNNLAVAYQHLRDKRAGDREVSV
jgi:hypothetical protein